jgi:RsmE family RNA methyltransferase
MAGVSQTLSYDVLVNLILLQTEDHVEAGRYRLADDRAQHVREVLRAEPGRSLRVGLLGGALGRATVEEVGEDEVVLACEFDSEPAPRPLTDLVLAIPRPKSLRKLLPEVTALGVDRLVLLRTWRVAKPYLTARILEPGEQAPLIRDGLMQGVSTQPPVVSVEPLFRPFVEDRLPALRGNSRALVAHPRADRDLAELDLGADERVIAAVGPEGGFLPYEVDHLVAAGFQPVSMGPRVLRVETACVALLAQIDLLRRRSVTGTR